MQESEINKTASEIGKDILDKYPELSGSEIGALLMYTGSYLVSIEVPDLWPELKRTANLAIQLLQQDETKAKLKLNEEENDGKKSIADTDPETPTVDRKD